MEHSSTRFVGVLDRYIHTNQIIAIAQEPTGCNPEVSGIVIFFLAILQVQRANTESAGINSATCRMCLHLRNISVVRFLRSTYRLLIGVLDASVVDRIEVFDE